MKWIFKKLKNIFIFTDSKNTVKKRRFKGNLGESEVEEQLSLLDENEYKIINNGLYRLKNDITVQIDHIVISRAGIFVIETKNYGGIITQKSNDNWEQIWFKKRFKIYGERTE